MSRRRPVLSAAEWNQLAHQAVNDQNEAVRAANLVARDRGRDRTKVFLDMALGSLEVTELLAEYRRLQHELNQVQVKFRRVMGEKANMVEYMPNAREVLLDRVVRRDPNLPAELMETIEFLCRQHGVDLEMLNEMPEFRADELIERLRRCDSVEEGQAVLRGFNTMSSIKIAKFARGE